MTADAEVTTTSHNADSQPEAASTRSRDAGTGATPAREDSTTLMQRFRAWRAAPVLTEDTRPGLRKGKRARTPWAEDLPSPRCVLEDYRDGARHYGGEAAPVTWGYWVMAIVPLLFNKLMAAGHVGSQRPGRFWGAVVILLFFVIAAHVLG